MKKLFTLILPVFLIIITMAGCGTVEVDDSLGYVTIDINPSIQFITDSDYNIEDIILGNEDAEIMLYDIIDELKELSVEEAIDLVLAKAVEFGYLDAEALAGDPNAVLITTMFNNANEAKENELRLKVKNRVNNFFKNNGVYGFAFSEEDINDMLTQAEELGISACKLRLINTLIALDDTLVIDDLLELDRTQLIQLVQEKKHTLNQEEINGVQLGRAQRVLAHLAKFQNWNQARNQIQNALKNAIGELQDDSTTNEDLETIITGIIDGILE